MNSSTPADPYASRLPASFEVDLPGGGTVHLQTQEEKNLWEQSSARYIEDYQLDQQNDRILIGSILAQQMVMFRAQQRIAGMVPEFDASGRPTGTYVRAEMKATEVKAASEIIAKCTEEIRRTEAALGIDKKTREAGGQHTTQSYVLALKRAAREYGLHVCERTLAYEAFAMNLRQKLRILMNADQEDRQYMGVSEPAICAWASDELAKLEQVDKDFAHQKGKNYIGKL